MKSLLTVTLLLYCIIVRAQSVYYVSATQGNDDNDGLSQPTAFANISRAVSVTQPGDTVKILPGTYRGTNPNNLYDEFLISQSGSPGNYITYQGVADQQGNLPVLESASLSGLTVSSSSYIVIDNLEFIPSSEDRKGFVDSPGADFGLEGWRRRRGINIINSSHHIVIRNLYVHDFPGNGIGIGGSDVLLIENNLVEHCAYETNNANSGISIYQPSLLDVPGFDEYPDHRLVFRGNTSRYNVNLRGFAGNIGENRVTDGNGIIIDDLRQEQVGGGRTPIPYGGRTLVINNVCYGNGGYGINVFSSDRADVYNNTLFDNGQSARIEDPPYEVAIQSSQLQVGFLDDVNVVNNILANADGSTATYAQFGATNLTFRNNIHWSTSGTVENVSDTDLIADPGFVQAQGLTPAQTELLATMTNPFDPNSPSAQLRTPTQNQGFPIPDLRLGQGSPAIDAGADVGFGTPVGSGIDIGALEYDTTNPPDSPSPDDTGTVVIRAKGSVGSEQMSLLVDDQVVERWTVATEAASYTYLGYQGGQLSLRFDNDEVSEAGDRNLAVDYLEVCGVRYEDAQGSVDVTPGCSERFSGYTWLWCNGSIDFGAVGCRSGALRVASLGKDQDGWVDTGLAGYPNPVDDRLIVRGSQNYGLVLYDLNGRKMLQRDHLQGTSTLDVSHLQPGVYVLKMSDGRGQINRQRIIVE